MQEVKTEGLSGMTQGCVCVQFSHGGSVEERTRVFGGDCTQVPDYGEVYIGRSTINFLATSDFPSAHRRDSENKGSLIFD